MKGSTTNALRVGVRGGGFVPVRVAPSQPKAKKSYMDIFCHNETRIFARSGEKWIPATICSGVRYLSERIEPPEKYRRIKGFSKKTTKLDY